MVLDEKYILANGIKIPKLGLGLFRMRRQQMQSVRLLRLAIATSTLLRLMKMNTVWGKESVPVDLPVRRCLLPQSWQRRLKAMRKP